MIRRLYVEKRPEFAQHAALFQQDIERDLGIGGLPRVRHLLRYDVEGVPEETWHRSIGELFAEPAIETAAQTPEWPAAAFVFAVEFLPGQFDQRADSAVQCLKLLADCDPAVRCAEVYILEGSLSEEQQAAVLRYRINPVDSRQAALDLPDTLLHEVPEPAPVRVLRGFTTMNADALAALRAELGLAMSAADLAFCQAWFRDSEQRDPHLTEIKVLDTYWSDHCRHTTFLAEITSVEIGEDPLLEPAAAAWRDYLAARESIYGERIASRPVCLMDIALMGMKHLRAIGGLKDLEVSEEVNAASIVVPVEVDGRSEEWLVMFKNETHNHPTEIEPFGGAATCLGGAIRDPLSGRSYVYQAMRVTGAADPRKPLAATLPGKLPQRRITVEAAHGYSSYGNQIGIATGMVSEVYHPGYEAKRMEIGAVIAAAPRSNVTRGQPAPGDAIVLVGGRTGRDGIGGATGSSKEHDHKALDNAAEVQKGDPPTERKLQRLFRDPSISRSIKRCNDFGAGGVSVAIGELADGLEINLDRVPLKYTGLDGTEIAISESQERMAVVLDSADVEAFIAAADAENLEAVLVAEVTANPRLRMFWRGAAIVDLSREFLDTNGVRQAASVELGAPTGLCPLQQAAPADSFAEAIAIALADLNVCSQRGLIERFDSTIGAGTLLHPTGGKFAATPPEAMAARLPLLAGTSNTATLMSYGFHPELASWSPFHGAAHAVLESVARLIASGARLENVHLTLQEYFERLRDDPKRWAKPFAALLGAWSAQRGLGIAAIGGKDSMSGSFNEMDVPPTLVSFAVATADAGQLCSPEFKRAGSPVLLVPVPRDAALLPDWHALKPIYAQVADAIRDAKVLSCGVVRQGGAAAAICRMAFGNRIGFKFAADTNLEDCFRPDIGALVLELDTEATAESLPGRIIGSTSANTAIVFESTQCELVDLQRIWEGPLEEIFPTRASFHEPHPPASRLYQPHATRTSKVKLNGARPRVLIPVFPGTNCEYDSARAFTKAGADVDTLVIRNQSHDAIEQSVAELAKRIDQSQILMLAGGFSAGDEPGGSGKFIATLFRNPEVGDALMRLLQSRDGLVLGICNGFQALVKLGLLPYGEIRPMAPTNPSLTTNTLGRHVSAYVRTKVVSKLSPWLADCPLGAIYTTAMSHGEGRFVGHPAELCTLFHNDQVACQYVDENGIPTHELPYNPNGSLHAIEAITSPCGRVFGRMGHTERTAGSTPVNVHGETRQPLFSSGVKYFS